MNDKPKKPMREGFQEDEPPVVEMEVAPPPQPVNTARVIEQQPEEDEPTAPEKEGRPLRQGEVTWPFIYKLRYKSLRIKRNEEVDQLTFREPSAGDIMDSGNPVYIEVKGTGKQMSFVILIDDNKMMHLLGNLCTDQNIQSAHLMELDPRDYNNIANRLRRFFRPDWEMLNF